MAFFEKLTHFARLLSNPNKTNQNYSKLKVERVKYHGYPVETHDVITEDDYYINLMRIPHGVEPSDNKTTNRSAILIVHGQGGSPHNFITLGKKFAPAYYFADRGFDVWLICARGVHCINPKKHKKYDWDKDPEYWNYSLHEIGIYDIAASVDYIIKVSGQQKMFYIGHSAGGPEFYAMISEKPSYNDKIKLNVNYGANPLIKEMDYPMLQLVCELSPVLKNIAKLLNIHEILPPSFTQALSSLIKLFCADSKFKDICKAAIWTVGSHVSTLIEDDVIEIVASFAPMRLGIKQMAHLMDNVKRGDFRLFDYGPKINKQVYGQTLPRKYNLTACKVPSAFFYGATDSLVTKEDMIEVRKLLTNRIFEYEVGPRFTHLDFIFAKNATGMVYEPTVKLFQDYDAGKIPDKHNKKEE